MADAVKALREHVQEKAPDELVRGKPHRLPAVRPGDAIILPAERDAGVVGLRRLIVGSFRLGPARTSSGFDD